ncbi:DUF4331 domain-containing protein [Actinoplanes sp. GCM10030250]|uniref:DUF4331 domain-containing protein n=1 Tax=Actinoplanes sp. GCM10030250 TaxID=3273376 RepID=UPI0036150646
MFRQPTGRPALGVAAALVAAACVASLAPAISQASSHREAPLVAGEPQLDNTDVYAFVSPDSPNTVTMIANWVPFEEPKGGPNFYPFANDAAYDINIDSDGDARADLIYRWTFDNTYRSKNTYLYNTGVVTTLDDPDLNFWQNYKLEAITASGSTVLVNNGRVAPSRVGAASMPNYAQLSNAAITNLPGGGRTFAGQADDPFFIDLNFFDNYFGGNFSEVGVDTVRGYNTNTIAIQVPKSALALKGDATKNPVVGIWSTTSRQRIEVVDTLNNRNRYGGWQQVSRLGMPLVNEVVIPVGRKDEFNATAPQNDSRFLPFVTSPEVPRRIQDLYKIPAPATPRNDLVEVFLTGLCKACGPVAADLNSQRLNGDVDPAKFMPSEQLRLNMSVPPAATPNRLGVLGGDNAGFPNGRRLADDVTDVTIRVAEGVLLPNHPAAVDGLSDAVDNNTLPFRGTFPYVALPNVIAVNQN